VPSALEQVKDVVGAVPVADTPSRCGMFEDGIYLPLAQCMPGG
jgi:hypothetical protein